MPAKRALRDPASPSPLASALPGRVAAPFSGRDLLLLAVLLAVATAVRLPYLQLLPMISDEALEVLVAQSVSRGNWIWFGPVDPTTGPLVTYLLALGFWLFGSGLALPRLVILVVGVLTVGLTYLLDRSMGGGRRAACIAGALMAFSPIHTIVNSHIAWSNATTPFFVALACLVLDWAARRGSGWLLVLGGFFCGLAVQSHVSAIAMLPGLLVWFLARRNIAAWLRRPWPYLAAGAAVLGYANMIVYQLGTMAGGLAEFQKHSYAWVAEPSLSSYLSNLLGLVKAVALTLGGQVPSVESTMAWVVTGLLLVWLVAALAYSARHGEWMPLLVILSTALIMPYFNKRYEGLLSQRYTAFLLPLAFAAMGMAAGRALEVRRARGKSPALAKGRGPVLAKGRGPLAGALSWGAMALLLILAVSPVRNTFSYYAAELAAGRDNRSPLAMFHYVERNLPSDTPLYLSANIKGGRGDGGYRYLRALYYYLVLEDVDHRVLDWPDLVARLQAEPARPAWLVLPLGDYDTLKQDVALEPLQGAPPVVNGGLLVRYVPSGEDRSAGLAP